MTELQKRWFQDNKIKVYEKTKIRINTEPSIKFIKTQRRRILLSLNKKQNKTIEYLGCNSQQFTEWLSFNFIDGFSIENHGKLWHIDHVIPISHFDIEKEQFIAFNWRNTTCLLASKNLQKNNSINSLQIEQHYNKLLEYHKNNNIEMPQEFIDLFAKHLVAGNPLEHSLPLGLRNAAEELG